MSVAAFLALGRRFAVVHGAVAAGRLCVLDSSFNPPHLGHLLLVTECVARSPSPVLLLLAVVNADKGSALAVELEHRCNMMKLMARYLEARGVAAAVGLTTEARFVDKAAAIGTNELTFVVGFDTLVRLVDGKYYQQALAAALQPFFSRARVFCLTRSDGSSVEEQQHWVGRVQAGQVPGVPAEWAERIEVVPGRPSTHAVSSSDVRSLVRAGDPFRHLVLPEVASYIAANHLYLQ